MFIQNILQSSSDSTPWALTGKTAMALNPPSNMQKYKCHAQKKNPGNYVHHGLKVRQFPTCFSNVPHIIWAFLLADFVWMLRQACRDVLKEGSRSSEALPQHSGEGPKQVGRRCWRSNLFPQGSWLPPLPGQQPRVLPGPRHRTTPLNCPHPKRSQVCSPTKGATLLQRVHWCLCPGAAGSQDAAPDTAGTHRRCKAALQLKYLPPAFLIGFFPDG